MPTLGELDSVISVGEYDEAVQYFEEKAPGDSGISKRYIVETGGSVKQTPLHIFNASLALGYFPKTWRDAKVVMVPKKSKSVSVVDFCPISLLEVPGKLLEKIIGTRLQARLESFWVFQNHQFGFRGKRGCRKAIDMGHELME